MKVVAIACWISVPEELDIGPAVHILLWECLLCTTVPRGYGRGYRVRGGSGKSVSHTCSRVTETAGPVTCKQAGLIDARLNLHLNHCTQDASIAAALMHCALCQCLHIRTYA